MPAHEPNPLREARVGLATMCLVLGVSATLIVLCNMNWTDLRVYRVGFRVNQDATGIEPGTPVTLGGLTWGHVRSVSNGHLASDGSVANALKSMPPGTTRGTLVEFDLDARIELHDGAKVARSATILGGNVQLVIVDTGLMRGAAGGLPTKTRGALAEGAVVIATEANMGLTSLVGPRAATRLSMLPDDVEAISKAWVEEIKPGINKEMDALRGQTGPLADAIRNDRPAWGSAVDRASASMDRLRAQLDPAPGPQPSVARDLSQGWDSGKPAFDAVQADFRALRDRLDQDTTPRAERLWQQANDEWTRVKELAARSAKAGADSIDAFQDFMANSSLMGGQIKRTFDELPAALLAAIFGKPGESGLQRLQRYEAASRLAVATDDLRRASDALESLADASRTVDPALAGRIRQDAAKAVLQFRQAVDALVHPWSQP